jgi:response regulator RpfG family c-di-GMP phosphodiesterase
MDKSIEGVYQLWEWVSPPVDEPRCLSVGMDDFVSKPLSLPILRSVIARFALKRLQVRQPARLLAQGVILLTPQS